MSDSGHEHDHVHISYKGAIVTFLMLGAIEIALGILIANPAVTNLGVHDISDVSIPFAGGFVGFLTIRLRRHWPTCQAEIWTAFLISISNIVVIGGITLISIPSHIYKDQLILGLGSAIVSFTANYYWANRLHSEDDEARRAVSKHLRLDAYAAIAVGSGSLVAYDLESVWPAIVAAAFVLGLTIKHSLPDLLRLGKQFHRQRNHLPITGDHHH